MVFYCFLEVIDGRTFFFSSFFWLFKFAGRMFFFSVVEMVGRMIVGGFVNFNPPPQSENLDPGLYSQSSSPHTALPPHFNSHLKPDQSCVSATQMVSLPLTTDCTPVRLSLYQAVA